MSIPVDARMLIGGRLVSAAAPPLQVLNPATEGVVGRAPDATDEQLEAAVSAANGAFAAWRAEPVASRQRVVNLIGAELRTAADELAALLTSEQGKPITASRAEVESSALWCDWFAQCDYPPDELHEDDTHRLRVRRVPLGVVAAIVPWNFPLALALWKIAPALLTGNTIVVKPSPFTPLTMLRLGELIRDVVPAGVVNVVTGGDDLGPKLTQHPQIQKIAFTGSSATGRMVMRSAADHLTRLTLELGGNDAAIVMPDVDVDAVAEKVFWSCFRNSGQVCIATKRVYVHNDIYDAFAERFLTRAIDAVVGNGMDDGVMLGPVQNLPQYRRVLQLIDECERGGLQFLHKGRVPGRPGYFIHPSVVDNPPDESPIVAEEAFGPLVPLLRFTDLDDAVARVNDSAYGLGASIWSSDLAAGERLAERIDSGLVWVNEAQRMHPSFPLAGHKASGIGSENGLEGLMHYTNPQVLSLRK